MLLSSGQFTAVPLNISSIVGPVSMALPTAGAPDAVAAHIRAFGYWEWRSPAEMLAARNGLNVSWDARDEQPGAAPKTFLDMGANLGFYSILFAANGYRSIAIEAMQPNRRALRATRCLNPALKIEIVAAALGKSGAHRECIAVSIERNRGNGRVVCGAEAAGFNCTALNAPRKRGRHDVAVCEPVRERSVDEVLEALISGSSWPERIDVAKLDVEGMECDVLDGARSWLLPSAARRPSFLQGEAAYIDPLKPRLGSRSEGCALQLAQLYGYRGCTGDAGTGNGEHSYVYHDPTVFLYGAPKQGWESALPPPSPPGLFHPKAFAKGFPKCPSSSTQLRLPPRPNASIEVSGAGYPAANDVYEYRRPPLNSTRAYYVSSGCQLNYMPAPWGWGIGCAGAHRYVTHGCDATYPTQCEWYVRRGHDGRGNSVSAAPVPTRLSFVEDQHVED